MSDQRPPKGWIERLNQTTSAAGKQFQLDYSRQNRKPLPSVVKILLGISATILIAIFIGLLLIGLCFYVVDAKYVDKGL